MGASDRLLEELVGSAWSRETGERPAVRAKPLPRKESGERPAIRAGGVPKTLWKTNPTRAAARDRGAADLEEARLAAGVSLSDLASDLGLHAEREGAEATSGALLVSFGELSELAPLSVFLRVVARAVTRRVVAERAKGRTPDDARLVAAHIDALCSLLT
jgi:hypothetical protein